MDEDRSYRQMLDALKQRAKQQYDEAVDAARRQYEKAVDAIEEVEHLVTGDVLAPPLLTLDLARRFTREATTPPATERMLESESPKIASDATLISLVEGMFRASPQLPLSVISIERRLRENGFAFKAVNPKASINTALTRLAERRIIYVTEKGSGRRPNAYRLLPFEKNNGAKATEDEGGTKTTA